MTRLGRRSPLARTGGLRRVGARKARTRGAEAQFKRALQDRSKGWCEVLTPACPTGLHAGSDAHHVCPSDRDRNVHDPDRGLWLCPAAHRWVHANPQSARRLGWLAFAGDRVAPTWGRGS